MCHALSRSPIARTRKRSIALSRSVILNRQIRWEIFEKGTILRRIQSESVRMDMFRYSAACSLRRYPGRISDRPLPVVESSAFLSCTVILCGIYLSLIRFWHLFTAPVQQKCPYGWTLRYRNHSKQLSLILFSQTPSLLKMDTFGVSRITQGCHGNTAIYISLGVLAVPLDCWTKLVPSLSRTSQSAIRIPSNALPFHLWPNSRNRIDKIILIIRQLISGNANLTCLPWKTQSPGKWPNGKWRWLPNKKSSPMITSTIPIWVFICSSSINGFCYRI